MSKKQTRKPGGASAKAAPASVRKGGPATTVASSAKAAGKANTSAGKANRAEPAKKASDGKFKPASKSGLSAGKAGAPKPAIARTVAAKPAAKASMLKGALTDRPVKAAAPARTMAVSKPEQTKKTEGGSKKMAPRVKVSEIVLPQGYRPSEDEPFMNEMHRAYFRKRLIEWKDEILRQTRETLAILHEDSTQHADLADRATSETDRATELRTRDRQRKLIAKIDAAVARIEDGSYGYCEETGEPIGLKRLDARPIATLSVEAQERHERREKVYREE